MNFPTTYSGWVGPTTSTSQHPLPCHRGQGSDDDLGEERAFDLAPASDQVIDQDDHCHHD